MSSITVEKVHHAANELHEAGTRPTLAAVREKLGGGSFTTISEAMKTWRQQLAQAQQLADVQVPAALDACIEPMKKAVWEVAQQEAAKQIQGEREALAEQRQKIHAEVAELSELMKALENEIKAGEEQNQQLAGDLAQMKSELENKESKIEQLRSDLQSQQEKLTRAEVFEGLFSEEKKKRESLEKELAELRAAFSVEKEKREALEEEVSKAVKNQGVTGDGQPKP